MNCLRDGAGGWDRACAPCRSVWTTRGSFAFPWIAAELAAHRFRLYSEDAMQRGVAQLLADLQVRFEREVAVSPRDRFDFLVAGGVVIETKIKGSYAAAITQCGRYIEHPMVTGVILLTTSYTWPRGTAQLIGKPVAVVAVPLAFA